MPRHQPLARVLSRSVEAPFPPCPDLTRPSMNFLKRFVDPRAKPEGGASEWRDSICSTPL
jgi:hypothetical protein